MKKIISNKLANKKLVGTMLGILLALPGFAQVKLPSVRTVRQVERAVASQLNKGLSVTGYFHQLGSGKIIEPPIQFSTPEIKTSRYAFQKRSRESLELEATALGFQSHLLETYSRNELEELVQTYKTFKHAADIQTLLKTKASANVPDRSTSWTRNDELFLGESCQNIQEWAHNQPDFYENNYWPQEYHEPFHPDITALTVLFVSDDSDMIKLFSKYVQTGKNITVVHTEDAKSGIFRLQNNSEKYDIIVTDFRLKDYNGFYVAKYVWNQALDIPVILLSRDPMSAEHLLLHNIVGQLPYPEAPAQCDAAFNYLSNIVATGKAYPNKNFDQTGKL